jgi:hypothetical protein
MILVGKLALLAEPIEQFKTLPGNPWHGDPEAIARSLDAFGQRKPIVARTDGTVIAGNHTLEAALSLGATEIAAVWVEDDDATGTAYALADNRTAQLGFMDEHSLAEFITIVRDHDLALLAATAYTEGDHDALLAVLDATDILKGMTDQDVLDAANEAGWPSISAKVAPDIYERFVQAPGDDDASRIGALVAYFFDPELEPEEP